MNGNGAFPVRVCDPFTTTLFDPSTTTLFEDGVDLLLSADMPVSASINIIVKQSCKPCLVVRQACVLYLHEPSHVCCLPHRPPAGYVG